MRAALIAVLSALALLAAGCGGEDVGAGGDSPASMLKSGALVYWETDSDPDSDQWKEVEDLLERFPDGKKWLTELRTSFEEDTDITWNEVRQALGDRFGLAVYARSMDEVNVVGLMKPDDPDKTLALVKRANEQEDSPEDEMVARNVDGWVFLSDEETSIDAAVKGDGEALADVQRFEDGMAELPDDALSRVYVDVAAAIDSFGGADPEITSSLRMLGLDQIEFAGAWAKARDDGAEFAGALRGEGADKLLGAADEYSSKLLDLVPADAFAFYSFQGQGVTQQFEALRGNPLYGMALRDFEQEAGIKLDDLVRLFQGEVAFYAAPGSPIPELTLLLDADDPAAARQSAEQLLRSVAQRGGANVTEDGDVTTAAFPGFAVNLGSIGDTVVITTTKNAILRADGDGEKLADSDRYKQALDAADAPDQYTGLVYVDLVETIETVMGFAASSGETVPPEVSRNLEPLRSLVAYGAKDGDLASSLVFVGIQ
ncbi:MAG TPA: DUF3352 domain-containing protein [Gaiellaceae bacterium]|nr:DUF3352 domain-containing protein [Gaiellaceae bacterium]